MEDQEKETFRVEGRSLPDTGPVDQERRAFSERFRKVSNRYPRRVTEAFGGDQARAMAATDEEVKATVRAWEIEQGLEPGIGKPGPKRKSETRTDRREDSNNDGRQGVRNGAL